MSSGLHAHCHTGYGKQPTEVKKFSFFRNVETLSYGIQREQNKKCSINHDLSRKYIYLVMNKVAGIMHNGK